MFLNRKLHFQLNSTFYTYHLIPLEKLGFPVFIENNKCPQA